MPQINRTGEVRFHDASFCINEEYPENRSYPIDSEFERGLKKQVFSRIIQQLNRMGWNVGPYDDPYKICDNPNSEFNLSRRSCSKGDLFGTLETSGRRIEFKMWQDKYNIDRHDGQGRFEFNKADRMPYVMRLQMEWTRNRLRNYLCNIFSGYEFKSDRKDGRRNKRGPNALTALEWIAGCYETSCHFKGDTSSYDISSYNSKSADDETLNHGQRVWFFDGKGRCCTGIAYYNVNSMWWVATGKYDVTNEAASRLHTKCPEMPRYKRNQKLRRSVLERLMNAYAKKLDFIKAEKLRKQLNKTTEVEEL